MNDAKLAELASQMGSAHVIALKWHGFRRAESGSEGNRGLAPEGCFSMIRWALRLRGAIAIGLAIAASLAYGQSDLPGRSILRGAAVEYLFPEQVTVIAGKPIDIALHFRIAQGLHINSHTPKDEFLIPTTFSIPNGGGVRLDKATYPAGEDFIQPLDPTTKLSVYTGEFTIQTRIVAAAGNHLVEAKLRYQACDKNACMPPKTIPVAIDVIAK
jgi:hypothetical protein